MTVADLIRYLEKLPKNTVIGVVFRCMSDYEVLDENDMTLFGVVDDKTNSINVDSLWARKWVMRNGRLMEYDKRTWPKEETPNFVPVLILPGN